MSLFCTHLSSLLGQSDIHNALGYSGGTNIAVVSIGLIPRTELPPILGLGHLASLHLRIHMQRKLRAHMLLHELPEQRTFTWKLLYSALKHHKKPALERILAIIYLDSSSLYSSRDCKLWFYDKQTRLQPIRN